MPDTLALLPFPALRFAGRLSPAELGARLSPPYDVIDDARRAELLARDEHNCVRLILPDGYELAAALLGGWVADGTLGAEEAEALYVYEEATPDGHVQRGLVGALRLSPPEAGVVLPHENTMAGPVADRLALMEATAANLEPIFLVYEGGGPASAAVAAAGGPALLEAETPDQVTHRVWAIRDPAVLDAIAADLAGRRAVIADGHHRYATYLRYQQLRHEAGDGDGPWDYGLTLLVDSSAFGPQVHPIHRVLPGLAAADAAERAGSAFSVHRLDADEDLTAALAHAGKAGPAFVVADGRGGGWLLGEPSAAALESALPADRSAAWRALDVAVAHHLLVRSTWGLPDDEETVWYRHDLPDALQAAAETGGTALLLNPTPVAAVAAVAAAGDRMPRKSTLFTPKPATGLLMRLL
jgi:uncharacterized protein (DUF1015 family)